MTLYLDTETTGLKYPNDDLVEVALIDEDGQRLLDTLCRPSEHCMLRGWATAQSIHGIGPDQVADAPPSDEVRLEVERLVQGQELVIYNARFDLGFFSSPLPANDVNCAMLAAQRFFDWYKWPKLVEAAEWIGYDWDIEGIPPHRAAGDALATRAVWQYMFVRE
ncbi:exonuclease domain-containing protein [Fodinicurvata halophila]|uniref:Exonuclease domain-containing protein n=1 Tax=Fodinicurvata halophila TaxID=1419723 RepID=A0ABV8ULX8_9PROT